MDVQRQFLEGLADEAGFARERLDHPGTTVVEGEERRGSGVMVCYLVGAHSLIWCDPELHSRLEDLSDDEQVVDHAAAAERALALGLVLRATADMRVLPSPAASPDPIDARYNQHWLQADNPAHVDLVRAFADRSDPDDVEEAALDELDDFAEVAINVLTDASQESDGIGDIVAYASAAAWDWDASFADIGVLVDPAHRGRGLGSSVVAHTVARLQADGFLPLYRHSHRNVGSRQIAIANGFEVATSLAFFMPAES